MSPKDKIRLSLEKNTPGRRFLIYEECVARGISVAKWQDENRPWKRDALARKAAEAESGQSVSYEDLRNELLDRWNETR